MKISIMLFGIGKLSAQEGGPTTIEDVKSIMSLTADIVSVEARFTTLEWQA